jgi:hypothetical protein
MQRVVLKAAGDELKVERRAHPFTTPVAGVKYVRKVAKFHHPLQVTDAPDRSRNVACRSRSKLAVLAGL